MVITVMLVGRTVWRGIRQERRPLPPKRKGRLSSMAAGFSFSVVPSEH